MENEFNDYVSISSRLAQSQNDRANNLAAYGNWSIGSSTMTTYTDGSSWRYGDSAGSLGDQSLRDAIHALDRQTFSSYRWDITSPDMPREKKSEEQKNKIGLKVLEKIKAAAKVMTVNEKDGELAISKAEEYRILGLEDLANAVEHKTNKILREMSIAVAGYKRINRSELDAFHKELSAVSDSTSKRKLSETPLAHYIGQNHTEGDMVAEKDLAVPPQDVLEKLKIARDAKLFDEYSVLHIQFVPDPILCGKIKESNDLYFVAEWGSDVKLSDIIKE